MLFRDGVAISELKKEDKNDPFVKEYEQFKKKYDAVIKARDTFRLIPTKPISINKSGLPERPQTANIEMRVTKEDIDGISHEYLWVKGMPQLRDGEIQLNPSNHYYMWRGYQHFDEKQAEIAFFLSEYCPHRDKIFKVYDPEAEAKVIATSRRQHAYVQNKVYNEEGICDDKAVLLKIAEAVSVVAADYYSEDEIANLILDKVDADIDKKGDSLGLFNIFKSIVDEVIGGEELILSTQEEVEGLPYKTLKESAGVTANKPKEELVKIVCEKLDIEYKES